MTSNSAQGSTQDPEEQKSTSDNKGDRVGSATSRSGGENPWRLVLLSSKIRQSTTLTSASKRGVKIVPYKCDTCTLDSLLAQAQQALGERKVDSIAIITTGQQSSIQLVANAEKVSCLCMKGLVA